MPMPMPMHRAATLWNNWVVIVSNFNKPSIVIWCVLYKLCDPKVSTPISITLSIIYISHHGKHHPIGVLLPCFLSTKDACIFLFNTYFHHKYLYLLKSIFLKKKNPIAGLTVSVRQTKSLPSQHQLKDRSICKRLCCIQVYGYKIITYITCIWI